MPITVGSVFTAIFLGLVIAYYIASRGPGGVNGQPVANIKCDNSEQLAVHYHAQLTITYHGTPVSIPAQTGILTNQNCFYWLHTHTTSGIIHIEAPKDSANRQFTVGDFFLIWNQPLSSKRVATFTVGKGDELKIGRYVLVGEEYTDDDNANYGSQAALLQVFRDGRYLTRLNPEERFFKASGGQPVHIVANYSTLREDLYVVYEGRDPDNGHPIIKAHVKPLVNWIWIGWLVIVLGTGMALVPNAATVTAQVPQAIPVAAIDKQGMQPAGVGK